MAEAIGEAQKALLKSEVPIGAVVVKNNKVIAASHNLNLTTNDPTGHAELIVIRQAASFLKTTRLTDCDLYVTIEPCPMCAQAISFARIKRLYFGAYDEKGGGVINGASIFKQKSCFFRPEIYPGIMETECAEILKNFFKTKRV